MQAAEAVDATHRKAIVQIVVIQIPGETMGVKRAVYCMQIVHAHAT